VLFDGWHSFFRDRVAPRRMALAVKVRTQLEEDALPHFVAAQRWYGVKGKLIRRVAISNYAEWDNTDYKWLLALVSIEGAVGESLTCFLPLALASLPLS
jgi:maltose alpha-D-glucosyltransferase/alpha-amylase